MKIGGLQPVTLLDYPQKVAAIIFASGCNMRCPFCYNPSLVLPKFIEKIPVIDESETLRFLKKRKRYLDGVVIGGGEPTLQPDLIKFCRQLKKINYAIKLDTNGSLPEVLEKLINSRLIDYIAMDLKSSLKNYSQVVGLEIDPANIKKSIALIMKSGLPYEFRTTLVRYLHTYDDIEDIAKLIKGANKYFLQGFRRQTDLVDQDFNGRSFPLKTMIEFKNMAGKYVKVCEVR